MVGAEDDRVFEVEDDGTVVPLFGPPPVWLRLLAGAAGIAVWAGLGLAIFGGAVAVGGALNWDWMWFGAWLALGGFVVVWVADRAAPAFRGRGVSPPTPDTTAVVPFRRP